MKATIQTLRREEEKTNKILVFMDDENPKNKEHPRSELKEPRVMESAIEKIEKARKPDTH